MFLLKNATAENCAAKLHLHPKFGRRLHNVNDLPLVCPPPLFSNGQHYHIDVCLEDNREDC